MIGEREDRIRVEIIDVDEFDALVKRVGSLELCLAMLSTQSDGLVASVDLIHDRVTGLERAEKIRRDREQKAGRAARARRKRK